MTIAFLDVHYEGEAARAACVLVESWEADAPSATFVQDIEAVEPYEPGSFYRRELPCLVSVLRLLPSAPDAVVIDGYVWLASLDRAGLGAWLYESLCRATPVVGIAKTAFAGAESSDCVTQVFRGSSRHPLFVTAAGMELEAAARHVRAMAGKHRIPEIVRTADQLSRGKVSSA